MTMQKRGVAARLPNDREPVDRAAATKQTPIWQNRDWAVTPRGLETKIVAGEPPNTMVMPWFVERERLLDQWPDARGVSNWLPHFAQKGAVRDFDALVDAVTEAIRFHHPDQKVIDLRKSVEFARPMFDRAHARPTSSEPRETEYVLGEALYRRWQEAHADQTEDDHGRDEQPAAGPDEKERER